ncbi:MAG TPA: GNAT family N-acetyltransferase [Caulobacteraceae bacterium]
MALTPTLQTRRLWLRPLRLADAPAIQRRFPRWEVVRFLSAVVPWPYPADGAEVFVAGQVAQMEAGMRSLWGLWLKGGPDEVIGIIELWPPRDARRDSRGFWLDPDFQGRGLMTEAADAVTDYAFRELGWPFLWLGNAKANIRSARVKERQGALLIDEVPFAFVSGKDLRQVWLLEAKDWLARRGPGGLARK